MTDMYLGVAAGHAIGDASVARRRADRAERELAAEKRKNSELKSQLSEALDQLNHLNYLAEEKSRSVSAGFIVMNAMILAMKNLPENLREQFAKEVVTLSEKRILAVDQDIKMKAEANNRPYLLVSEIFKNKHSEQFKLLGFDS